jgi:hypothetical protein
MMLPRKTNQGLLKGNSYPDGCHCPEAGLTSALDPPNERGHLLHFLPGVTQHPSQGYIVEWG